MQWILFVSFGPFVVSIGSCRGADTGTRSSMDKKIAGKDGFRVTGAHGPGIAHCDCTLSNPPIASSRWGAGPVHEMAGKGAVRRSVMGGSHGNDAGCVGRIRRRIALRPQGDSAGTSLFASGEAGCAFRNA